MAGAELLLHERQSIIRKRLAERGRGIAGDLAQEFSISEDTIRRDLREMAAAGLCRRVYGGALPADDADYQPLTQRLGVGRERKLHLARAAVELLRPKMTVFIDAGSTNVAIAEAIPVDLPLVVITNAPLVAAALLERPHIEVIVIGGRLDQKSGSVLGAKAMQDAAGFHPDLCVLGSCGLDIDAGISASFFEEAEFKRFIAQRSRSVAAAVTNEKLGVAAPFTVLPLNGCRHVVVEHDADAMLIESLAALGVEVARAQA